MTTLGASAPSQIPLPAGGSDLRTFAIAYLNAGWSILPIQPMAKKALVKWEPYQTSHANHDNLDEWVHKWPSMNLGIVTGAISGIAALDIDGEAGVQSLRASGLLPPATLLQQTPHGWHAIYRLNGQPVKTGAGLLPHVDTRGEGGYIVCTPSVLSDGVYRWHRNLPLAPVPSWMEHHGGVTQIQVPTPVPQETRGTDWIAGSLRNGVLDGQRNVTATRLAGYLHHKRLPDDVIFAILQPFAAQCTPPIDDRELVGIVQSVCRYDNGTEADGGVLRLP